jgi:hypothetical protein
LFVSIRMKPPNRESRSSYRIQEFAELTGVTVRALHHYDRLGLLKPLRRTRTGYRVYRNSDFARLEQIVVLKFLGLPLKDIGRLLKKESHLQDTLGSSGMFSVNGAGGSMPPSAPWNGPNSLS